jgi:hypothetical protein
LVAGTENKVAKFAIDYEDECITMCGKSIAEDDEIEYVMQRK